MNKEFCTIGPLIDQEKTWIKKINLMYHLNQESVPLEPPCEIINNLILSITFHPFSQIFVKAVTA